MTIRFENVNVDYAMGPGEPIRALTEINCEFPSQGIVYVCGPNGSGKSTLLKTIVGELSPSGGRVVREAGTPQSTILLRPSPLANLAEELTVLEHLFLSSGPRSGGGMLQRVSRRALDKEVFRLIEQTLPALRERMEQPVQLLSSGQQQALAIVCGLLSCHGHGTILLDEPTASLDQTARRLVGNLLRGIAVEFSIAVVVATHDYNLLADAPGSAIVLREGRLQQRLEHVGNDVGAVLDAVFSGQDAGQGGG